MRDPEHKLLTISDIYAVDYQALGNEYCRAIRGLLPERPRLLEKTPTNFMFLGLILKAIPNAKIVHLQRHPVDACYAIYKTLFSNGYEFSYDLEDMGHYYAAYLRLMEHWRTVLPGASSTCNTKSWSRVEETTTRRMLESAISNGRTPVSPSKRTRARP